MVYRPTQHILGHFNDGGVTVALARLVVDSHSVLRLALWLDLQCNTTVSVCVLVSSGARPLSQGVYVCHWKTLCRYILVRGYDSEFLWNMPLLTCLQTAKLSDAQALPTSWLGWSTRGHAQWWHAQGGSPSVTLTAGIHYKSKCLL